MEARAKSSYSTTQSAPTGHHTLNGKALEQVADCHYPGVTLQEDLGFTKHIEGKITNAQKQFGMVKHALYFAPQKVKLLAYQTLCLPHLEYAAAARNPSGKRNIALSLSKFRTKQSTSLQILKALEGLGKPKKNYVFTSSHKAGNGNE